MIMADYDVVIVSGHQVPDHNHLLDCGDAVRVRNPRTVSKCHSFNITVTLNGD